MHRHEVCSTCGTRLQPGEECPNIAVGFGGHPKPAAELRCVRCGAPASDANYLGECPCLISDPPR